jgi:poly(beta-D-mannuronate) lyase
MPDLNAIRLVIVVMACIVGLPNKVPRVSAENAADLQFAVNDPNASYFDVTERRTFLREHISAPELQPLGSRFDDGCDPPPKLPDSIGDPVAVQPLYDSAGGKNPGWSESARPFHEVRKTAISIAKSYVVTGNSEAARCLVDYLSRLAAEQALTRIDLSTRQSLYTVAWTAADIALTYSIVRGDVSITDNERQPVERWLNTVVRNQIAVPGRPGVGGDCCNNMLYWRGLQATATGIVTSDPDLLNWGMATYRRALEDMNDDGSLPGEMGRGVRALHYQSFAIWPLIMIAELAERQGYALYTMDIDGKTVHLAVDFLMRALADPSVLKPYTSEPQNMEFANFLPWAEIYQRRFPRPDLKPYIGRGGGEIALFGGPMTLYFFQP